jgi:hypothetical protein
MFTGMKHARLDTCRRLEGNHHLVADTGATKYARTLLYCHQTPQCPLGVSDITGTTAAGSRDTSGVQGQLRLLLEDESSHTTRMPVCSVEVSKWVKCLIFQCEKIYKTRPPQKLVVVTEAMIRVQMQTISSRKSLNMTRVALPIGMLCLASGLRCDIVMSIDSPCLPFMIGPEACNI